MPQKIIYQTPQYDSSGTFNRNCVFKLEEYGLLEMIFVEFTLQGTGQTYTTPTSPYLIKDVSLESYGNRISHVTTSYTLGRLDELQTDIYNQVVAGANLTGAELTAAQTITLPLYFFAIDGQKLDTRRYKNLSVRVVTKDNHIEMGFNGNITINSIRLKMIYQDPKLYVETPLKNFYNVYREIREITSIEVGPNTNVERVLINNPYKVSNLYFMIRKTLNGAIKGQINSIKLIYPNNEIGIYDNKTNYTLNSTDNANLGNTFAINIGSRYKLGADFVEATGQQVPLIAEITYVVADVNTYKLYIACEYYSDIKEGPDGMIIEETPGSFLRF